MVQNSTAPLSEARHDEVEDPAMMRAFGRVDFILEAAMAEQAEFVKFFHERLGPRKRTAAQIATREPTSADDRLLQLMAMATEVYATALPPSASRARGVSAPGSSAGLEAARMGAPHYWR